VLALVLGTGCAAVRRPAVAPLAQGPLPAAADLLTLLRHERTSRTSLRTLAKVAYDGPDGNGHTRQVLVVARPTRLRIEVLSALGSLFVLTADDGVLAAYAPREGTIYRGHASRANLWRYAHVDLSVADVVNLLLGTPPPRVGRNEVVSFDPEMKAIELWREIDSGAQVVWFNGMLRATAVEERDNEGRVRWRARFEDFAPNQADLPQRVEIEIPPQNQHLAIDLQDPEINPTLTESIFRLSTPPGVAEVHLDDTAGSSS
jgi:hypothetical protein